MNLLQQFIEHIKKQHLFSPKDKLLLAVSGGVDSVVLCELCKQAGYDFIIAHCNFKLRGGESERDELFVRELGKKYGVEVLVEQFDTTEYAAENKLSTQEAARELRYKWFAQLAGSQESGVNTSSLLLTAHHADDNNETLLMNFFRGTGLHGLTGIPATNNYIRRPLLKFFKHELVAFAQVNNIGFAEDSSNQSSKYTRNFFRNDILPAISKVYPQVNENLQDNISRFAAIEKLYQISVAAIKQKLCKFKGHEIHIPYRELMGYDSKALIYEIISGYGFNEKQVEQVIKLAESDSGKYIQSPGENYRIIKHRNWFIISPVITAAAENIVIEESDRQVVFSLGELRIRPGSNLTPPTSKETVLLDAKEIQFPLLLRKRKAGDYFYPLGMKKKKKLNRFLIDEKLSTTEKENVWVLESAQRIIWVVGYRIDERFKITPTTKRALQLVLAPAK
ncbi:MAG: tRNA lysidine(34) synthetase TilS [Chitinophagaceae bacterium]